MQPDAKVRELIQAAGELAWLQLRVVPDLGTSVVVCAGCGLRSAVVGHAVGCFVGRVFEALAALNEAEEEFFRVEGRPTEEAGARD